MAVISILIAAVGIFYLVKRVAAKNQHREVFRPKQTAVTWAICSSSVIGSLIIVFAVAHLFYAGFAAAHRDFNRLMDFAMLFVVLCALLGLRYSVVAWKDRPEKQQRLHTLKLLILLLVLVAIPTAVANWLN